MTERKRVTLAFGPGRKLPAIPTKVTFEGGWVRRIDVSPVPATVQIKDRLVPIRLRMHLDGPGGQPSLDLLLEVVDGVPQCRELVLRSTEIGREVKPRDLAAVRLLDLVDDAYVRFALEVDDTNPAVTRLMGTEDTPEAEAASIRAFQEARKGNGARKINRAFLEEVAEVHDEYQHARPVQAVAQRFGVTDRMASNYVTRARELGLLPPTTRGKKSPRRTA